ncbi:MAG: bifunctional 3-deoxy-7-phosphoheptulonate synthase/chorismate mutase [Phycisphaerales bacterium]|nr:bifunctional 3-deoxy-7-phosphoheptulonate synthase/chorismate mutase [Phycisphaerales bacterium]
MDDKLRDLRAQLDGIDARLVADLAERDRLAAQIGGLKTDGAAAPRDLIREEALLTALADRGRAHGLDAHYLVRLYREILDHSVRVQHERFADRDNPRRLDEKCVTVAYQGTEGAYSHLAACRHFGTRAGEVRYQGFDSFPEMLQAVRDAAADYAMLPIENTTAGSINEAYDLLARMDLSIVGEEVHKVEHCLLALEAVPLSRIRRVYSHPKAIDQCTDFLRDLAGCHVESYTDTAMAARKIRDDQDLSQAAIASDEAARLYGLSVLRRDIANQKENYTRFFVVAREPMRFDARIPCKTSILLATRHEEGALLRCLNTLAAHHLNLTKLESRPRPHMPWEYLFYLDFEGNLAEPRVGTALAKLAGDTSFLKVLGSYPARTTRESRPAAPRPGAAAAAALDGSAPSRNEVSSTTCAGASFSAEASQSAGDDVLDGAEPGDATAGAIPLKELEKKPYKLVSRASRTKDSQFHIGHVVVGGDARTIIAGPCSVESREQILSCAKLVRELGGHMLRGGCFKPRTSPYAFQGLGYEGLDLLAEAGRMYDLPIVTEVMHPADLARVAEKADVIQLGARNMQNFSLLKEIGRIDRPVILKRGMMASIDEWLAAAEYILAHGNQQVILCERGIRTFETATRNTLDLSAVPVVKELTHLPVIVDPSHACGTWRWVPSMTEAAMAAGAHGVMVEIHPEPAKALSDGPQALTFDVFTRLMGRLQRGR